MEITTPNYGAPAFGAVTEIGRITDTLIITCDGGRYSRQTLRPAGGRGPRTTLHSAHSDEAVTARALQHLVAVSRQAGNLAALEHKTPENVCAALAQLSRAVSDSHSAIRDLMAEASKANQESRR